MNRLDEHTLENGMVLLGEPMEGVESAAFIFSLPAGAAAMPDGCCGAANVLSEWIFRGAGDMDSRALGDALDGFGLHRIVSVGPAHLKIGAVMEAGRLEKALGLYAEIICRPILGDDSFIPSRQLALDAVAALQDDPRRRVMHRLTEQFYTPPWNRSTVGRAEEIAALDADRVRQLASERFRPPAAVFAVAGKYDFDAVCRRLEDLFGDARGNVVEPHPAATASQSYRHFSNDGAQVHIGMMTPAVPPAHPHYYDAQMATAVLSGGMSARLFTEVREKRGLCYAVGANYHGLKDAAAVRCYAGTTPEKAQETTDVIIEQFKLLVQGIKDDEVQRARVGAKSSLVLHSESSSSRASSIVSDYYLRGRVRSLDEISRCLDRTSVDSVLAYLNENPFEDFTLVTIGPRQITFEESDKT